MKIYDISMTLSPDMLRYPGDPPVRITSIAELGREGYALSRISMGSHTGTHVDPQAHFIAGGLTVDRLPLEALVGPAVVVDAPEVRAITAAVLEALGLPNGVERVLFKTSNGALWEQRDFQEGYVYLEESAAWWLVEHGVRLVGIDYLSVDRYEDTQFAAHRTLLGAGVIILEGIDLRQAPAGAYTLVCLPLKLQDGDGAPARAILMKDELGATQ